MSIIADWFTIAFFLWYGLKKFVPALDKGFAMLGYTKEYNASYIDALIIKTDENGNTGDEKTFRKGIETGVIHYYYDDKGRLTDIVRYNTKAKKLLPDILFEYDDNDRIIQKITTTSSINLGYLIWRYIFDERGLKTKEALFNKEKKLLGRIDFSYN